MLARQRQLDVGIEEVEAPLPKAPRRERIEVIDEEVQRIDVGEEFFDEEKFPFVERYKIQPGDELEISVWQHPELLRTVVVRPDGFISFPLAGDVRASGMTAEQLCKQVSLRLGRILRKPEVSVIVSGFGAESIFVLGAVNTPGLYPYRNNMTALGAISAADGWQPHSYLKSVLVVKRGFSDEADVTRVNLWDVIKKGDMNKDIALEPGDIVYVPQSFIGNLGTFMDGLRFKFGTGFYMSHTVD
jgi:polysaccharide export outer membrane protein